MGDDDTKHQAFFCPHWKRNTILHVKGKAALFRGNAVSLCLKDAASSAQTQRKLSKHSLGARVQLQNNY